MKSIRSGALVALVFTVFCALPAGAQDASQVLRLSVGFRTLKNTASVDEATRQTVADLEKKAQAATNAQKYSEAYKHYSHAMALLRQLPWTPLRAFSAALQVKADKLVFDPGEQARLKLAQLFALDEPVAGKLKVTLALAQTRGGKPETVKELQVLPEAAADFTQEAALAGALPQTPDGNYLLVVTLTPTAGEPLVKNTAIRIERDLQAQTRLLKARVNALRAEPNSRPANSGLARADYAATLLDLINRGELPLDRFDLKTEFANANALLDEVAKGEDPLRAKRGDVHWAYHSAVDSTPQPYRLFIPAKYDAKQKWPLVVALHGMGGDENGFFTNYAKGIIKEEAERRGYLIVCPKGRGPASMYMGSAEKDVLDVLAEVKRQFNVDEDRVYLMGHSMGGYGTWSVAANNPEPFAALAPIAGGGTPFTVAKLKNIAHIPWLVTHGDKDPTVPVEESRKMVKLGKDLGVEIKYNEVPGGDHGNVVVPAFKEIFDWFDAHKRQPKAAVKAAGQ